MQFGIIGKKLSHSISPFIHQRLFDCVYEKKEINENELLNFLLKRDFKGINVTIPYKKAVIPYLDFLDDAAKSIGAVNTIVNKDGKLYGYNTDFSGLKALIQKNGISLFGKNVIILGSGGTSLTATAVSKSLGAKSVTRFSRSGKGGCESYSNSDNYYDLADIIINTTPCGMYPEIYESAISIDGFNNLQAVIDVVYNPVRTKLVVDAQNKGIKAVGGMYMLVSQALFSARLFSNSDIPSAKGEEIYNALMSQRENIVLIGMPSSGKSTVAKIVSKALGRTFIDTDDEIYKSENMPAGEIITLKGEDYFRKIETAVIRDVSKNQGCVIATGGGAVKLKQNIDLLKENGKIFFIDRDFSLLTADKSRPLSSTKEKLAQLYGERLPLYQKYSDITVINDDCEKAANTIIKAMNL